MAEALLPIHSPDAKRRKTMVDPLFQWYRTAPRRVWDQVLGSGHHLQRTGKHVIARIHEAFKHGYITINTALVKDGFDRLASRTAWLAGVSRDTVEQVVREGNLGLGWADPKPRGGQPWEKVDIAPHDQIAAVRRAHAELAAKIQPTSVPKIKRHMEAHGFTDVDGNAIVLPKHRILRILQICGYRFGSAGHHHVAKDSKANKNYRVHYVHGMRKNRDEDGLPIRPEVYYDESYVRCWCS
eukprot:COSAG01_NODE_7845_length_3028_cov_8.342438_3_plen_240_part_00